jgi:hypothetical protein
MSEKITLPKEVAEAIAQQRGFDHGWLLYDIELMAEERHSSANKSLATIYMYYKQNKQAYFSALVNGYEIEQTPEEELRNFYEETVRVSNECSSDSTERVYNNGIIRGTEYSLKILGIDIEGINA